MSDNLLKYLFVRNKRPYGEELKQFHFQVDAIGVHPFLEVDDRSCVFIIMEQVMQFDDFYERWCAFQDVLNSGYLNGKLMPSKQKGCFLFGLRDWDGLLFRKERGFYMRILEISDGYYINEVGFMTLLIFMKLATGVNYLDQMPYAARLNMDELYGRKPSSMNPYIRTLFLCLCEVGRRLKFPVPSVPKTMNLIKYPESECMFTDALAYVVPKMGLKSNTCENLLAGLGVLIRKDVLGGEIPINYEPYVTKKEASLFEGGCFRRFFDFESADDDAYWACRHTFSVLSPDVRKAVVKDEQAIQKIDALEIANVRFVSQIHEVQGLTEALKNFKDKQALTDRDREEVLKQLHDLDVPTPNKSKKFYDMFEDEQDYPLDKFMSGYVESFHRGAKKNMIIMLDFIDYYKEWLMAHRKSTVYVIGCGHSYWYQYLALLFYDRKVVFIDELMKVKAVQKLPNVVCITQKIDQDFVFEPESILCMDICGTTDDIDSLNLQQLWARKAGLFFYKVRTLWIDGTMMVYGDQVYIPYYSQLGSAEVRIFGCNIEGSKKDLLITKDEFTYVKNLTKLSCANLTCRSCFKNEQILMRYKYLPDKWNRTFERPISKQDYFPDSKIFLQRHKLGGCSIFVQQCSTCYFYLVNQLTEWLLPYLPEINEVELLDRGKSRKYYEYYKRKHDYTLSVCRDMLEIYPNFLE